MHDLMIPSWFRGFSVSGCLEWLCCRVSGGSRYILAAYERRQNRDLDVHGYDWTCDWGLIGAS
jgi:hypothetical protein